MAGDIQPVLAQVVGDERWFPVLLFIQRRGLLGVGAQVSKPAVMPHPLDQKRPFLRLVLQPVREPQARGILHPEGFALACRKRCRFRDPGLGVHLRGLGRFDGRLRHLPVVRHLAPCDKGGFMSGR